MPIIQQKAGRGISCAAQYSLLNTGQGGAGITQNMGEVKLSQPCQLCLVMRNENLKYSNIYIKLIIINVKK